MRLVYMITCSKVSVITRRHTTRLERIYTPSNTYTISKFYFLNCKSYITIVNGN